MTTAKQRVVEAVNYLIAAPNHTQLVNEITKIIERWDTHPMVYGEKLRFLNALIDVGLANRAAFEKLLALVEAKRKLIPEAKRVDYQRDLMRQRRARVAKAIELQELLTGKKLSGDPRKKFSSDIQARWKAARDAAIAAKGDLGWAERNDAAGEFWAEIDEKLDQNIRAERGRRKV